jgi:hypothetical protein
VGDAERLPISLDGADARCRVSHDEPALAEVGPRDGGMTPGHIIFLVHVRQMDTAIPICIGLGLRHEDLADERDLLRRDP